jgi:ribosomal 50S subunit-recycling heat shock protein
MQNLETLLLAGMLAATINSTAVAQDKESGANDAKPGKVVVEVVKLTGTVKTVDPQNKTVTVEGSGGRTVTVNAENARNLDQVKVGDKVNLRFTEELALFVRKSDAQPSATQTDMVALAPKGEKPAGLMARTVELTGTVESIDAKKRTVAVKGPEGNVRTFHVDKTVKNFNQIKKGDQIVLRVTQAVALSVVKS